LPEDVFVEVLGLCPECGAELSHVDNAQVCVECGLVWDGYDRIERDRIPMPEYDGGLHMERCWNPECSLAFGKNLGARPLRLHELFRVIVKGPNGTEDAGLRAKLLRLIELKVDHPYVKRLVKYGSQICKQFGLHRRDAVALSFAEEYGRVLRKLGAYYAFKGRAVNLHQIAKVAFIHVYQQFFGRENAEKIREELKVKEPFVSQVEALIKVLNPKGNRII